MVLNIVVWILVISAFTLFGAWYARRYEKPDALIGLYVIFLALSQIMAAKIASFDLGFTTVTAPAAVLVFSVTFLITDIVNEKFGRKETHKMIFIAFITQIAMAVFIYLANVLEPAPFWQNQQIWEQIFGVVPRIMIVSWITFLVSENLDAYLFTFIKKITKGKHIWARNVFSSIISLSVDTLFFVTLAFYGTGVPLWAIMVGQFFTKYMVAIIDIPFMYLNRFVMYKT